MNELSRQQADFLNAKTRGRIYLGSIGSGKTRIMCIDAIKEVLNGHDTLITSFSYRNLRDVVLSTILSLANSFGISYKVNQSDMTFTVNNHSIYLRSADSPDKLRSFNLHSFSIEEGRELTRETFDILLGRIRTSDDCYWNIVSTTRGKDWIYDIINEEGLTDIFDDGETIKSNNNLTVVRSTIDQSPFLPASYVKDLKKQYTTSFASQELYAQIVEMGGSIINPNWFKITDINKPNKGVRYWDVAVTIKNESDYSCGSLLSNNSGIYSIYDISRVKLSYPDLKKHIINTALNDGEQITIVIETAGQQRAIYDDLRRVSDLSNYVIKEHRPTKDKVTRSYPFASQCEAGNVLVNNRPWKKQLFDECSRFSAESVLKGNVHDDIIDSLTGAYEMTSKNTSIMLARI